jgi:hypothetical protein
MPSSPSPAPASAAVSSDVAAAPHVSSVAPEQQPQSRSLTPEEQRQMLDDRRLNDFMGIFKGAKITDMTK